MRLVAHETTGGLLVTRRIIPASPRLAGLDGRTTTRRSYQVSLKISKRVEKIFGWIKTVGGFRRSRYRGLERTQAWGNHGILQHELVTSSDATLLRRVACQAPDTGEIRVFLTTELTLAPGLIAHLYQRRWQIEKVFDSLKNKLNEKKSWAASPDAKAAQAEFLCLAHNLIRRMEQALDTREGVVNEPDCKRRSERLEQQKMATIKAGRLWPSTWDTLLKPVQYSVKLIRWLRSCFLLELAWTAALPRLRALYAVL